jgi:hypothetical protein
MQLLSYSITSGSVSQALSILRNYPPLYNVVAIALSHNLALWQVLACSRKHLYRDARTGCWTLQVLKPFTLDAKHRTERQQVNLFPALSVIAEQMYAQADRYALHPFRNCEEVITYIDTLTRGYLPRDAFRRDAIYNRIDPIMVYPNEQAITTNKA